MSTEAPHWPRLLGCWQDGRLRTVLLHADGRRAYTRDEPLDDDAQLAPALADALALPHRPVHHAVVITDTPMATDTLRQRLGLTTLCAVPRARALRLAPEDDSGWAGAARALDLALNTSASSAVCARIRAAYAHLTRCERRVADVVLANPGAALETATARLAEAAHVSQPQVIRFCRALGFDGLKSLKRALAQSLATEDNSHDAPTAHPLLRRSLNALNHVDRGRLNGAARLLAEAREIEVMADAARTPLLDLALRTLWRLGLAARPAEIGEQPKAPAGLALGAAHADIGILITERHQPSSAALQLVTGPESPAAPTLLAMLMLQLLLAELKPAPRANAGKQAGRTQGPAAPDIEQRPPGWSHSNAPPSSAAGTRTRLTPLG